jgi:hypothetical protein
LEQRRASFEAPLREAPQDETFLLAIDIFLRNVQRIRLEGYGVPLQAPLLPLSLIGRFNSLIGRFLSLFD